MPTRAERPWRRLIIWLRALQLISQDFLQRLALAVEHRPPLPLSRILIKTPTPGPAVLEHSKSLPTIAGQISADPSCLTRRAAGLAIPCQAHLRFMPRWEEAHLSVLMNNL